MKVVLLLCLTHSGHNYENLKSYINIIDEVFIYDTGLYREEEELINQLFKLPIKKIKDKFIDYSTMRNTAIEEANKYYKQVDWYIMPDDSDSISGITREILKKLINYDTLFGTIKTENNKLKCEKIIKPWIRYEGKVYEKIKNKKRKSCYVDSLEFEDTYIDYKRSLKHRKNLVDWNDNFHVLRQKQLYMYVLGKEIKQVYK